MKEKVDYGRDAREVMLYLLYLWARNASQPLDLRGWSVLVYTHPVLRLRMRNWSHRHAATRSCCQLGGTLWTKILGSIPYLHVLAC